MYSQEIESLLKSKKVKIGDRIGITKLGSYYEGILMPRIELGNLSSLVVKLDNGYNIGIIVDKKTKVKLLKGGKPIRFTPARIEIRKDPTKPNVHVLGCGGTIAARVEYTTGAVFPSFSPGDLLLSFPDLKEIANIQGGKLFDLLSEDMSPLHWQVIACEVAKIIKKDADGIVLTHGTDTMHYTSAALSFMLQSLPIPIVLAGSQRSSDRGSSDNEANLSSAVLAAGKGDAAEVMICMHGSMSDDFCYLHQGTKVRKLHTSRRDAFQSVNVSPFAKVWSQDKKIEYLRDDFRKRSNSKVVLDTRMNPNVGLIYLHPGIKPEFIESLSKFYEGVVIAGTGLGHLPTNPTNDKLTKSLVPATKGLISSGIPVVIAPQTIFGRINMNVYTAGRILNETGIIGNYCDWLPETAMVKLMWVLGHTKDFEKVKEMMLKNYAGEISERTVIRHD